MAYRGHPPYRGHSRPSRNQVAPYRMEGGPTPFMNPSLDSVEGTSDQVLRLRLEGQVLFSRALEMENFMFQGELNRLRECLRINNPPTGDQLVDPTPYPGGAH